jgi:hypothetical protein
LAHTPLCLRCPFLIGSFLEGPLSRKLGRFCSACAGEPTLKRVEDWCILGHGLRESFLELSELHFEGKARGPFAQNSVGVFDPFEVEEQSPGFQFGDFDGVSFEVLLVPDVFVPFEVFQLLALVDVKGVDVQQGGQVIFYFDEVVLRDYDVVAQLAHVAESHLPKVTHVGGSYPSEPDMVDHLPNQLISDQLLQLLLRKGHSAQLTQLRVVVLFGQQTNIVY